MPSAILERVTDRVYRIEDRFVNLYAIDAGRLVLVDTGTKKAEPLIRQGLREIGKEVADIGLVLLTHHHLDHVGTAGVWKRESRANVAVHETDASIVAGGKRPKAHGVGARGKAMAMFAGLFNRIIEVPPVEPDRTFTGDEFLDLLGLRVQVIHAPGHTMGSCAFLFPSEGILFAGDAVNGRRGKPEPPIFFEDAAAAMDSYRRLVSMKPAVLCPGHGDLIRTPPPHAEKAP